MIEMTVSSLVDSSLAQLPEIEQASFNDRVTIDTVNGVSGTTYPIGTQRNPVNNLADAKAIAAARGFDNFYILGNLTINSGEDVSNYHIFGQGATLNVTKTLVTLADGAITSNTMWHNLRITGKQGGESNYIDCIIDGIWNAHCHYRDCGFITPTGTYTVQHNSSVGSGHITDLHNCYSDEGTPVVDRNGAKMHQIYTNYSGRIKFINQNRVTESGSVYIHMNGGTVTIDSSCTKGLFVISGVCEVIDNSAGALVDTSQVSTSTGGAGFTLNQVRDAVWSKQISELTDKTTIGGFINKSVLTVAKFLGLK